MKRKDEGNLGDQAPESLAFLQQRLMEVGLGPSLGAEPTVAVPRLGER